MESRKTPLALLMFFQLAVLGAFIPIFSMYLKEYLGFSSHQAGYVFVLGAIPSILSPFFSSLIVDRFVTSRRFLMICHVMACGLMVTLSFERTFPAVMTTYFVYNIFLVPSTSLVNSIVFHSIEDSKGFGKIRIWGTLGWIFAGWLISYIWKAQGEESFMPLALILSSFFSLLVVLITLTLPRQELAQRERVPLIPKETFRVLKNRKVIFMLSLIFLFAITDKFYFFGMPLFLKELGADQNSIPRLMSLGQMSEVVMLFTLGFLIKKLGFKRIFTLALILQVARYVIFWSDYSVWLTAVGIFLHGIIFSCFFAAGTIYLDQFTDKFTKSGVHQLMGFLFAGVAGMVGHLLTGSISQGFVLGEAINFKVYWSLPLLLGVVTLVLLVFVMRED